MVRERERRDSARIWLGENSNKPKTDKAGLQTQDGGTAELIPSHQLQEGNRWRWSTNCDWSCTQRGNQEGKTSTCYGYSLMSAFYDSVLEPSTREKIHRARMTGPQALWSQTFCAQQLVLYVAGCTAWNIGFRAMPSIAACSSLDKMRPSILRPSISLCVRGSLHCKQHGIWSALGVFK